MNKIFSGSRSMILGGIAGLVASISLMLGGAKLHEDRVQQAKQNVETAGRAYISSMKRRNSQVNKSEAEFTSSLRKLRAADKANSAYQRTMPEKTRKAIPVGVVGGAVLGYLASRRKR